MRDARPCRGASAFLSPLPLLPRRLDDDMTNGELLLYSYLIGVEYDDVMMLLSSTVQIK